jgi:hypothetical protein
MAQRRPNFRDRQHSRYRQIQSPNHQMLEAQDLKIYHQVLNEKGLLKETQTLNVFLYRVPHRWGLLVKHLFRDGSDAMAGCGWLGRCRN